MQNAPSKMFSGVQNIPLDIPTMPAATAQGSDNHLAFLMHNSPTIEYIWIKIKIKNNDKKNTDPVPHTQEHSIPPNSDTSGNTSF